MNLQTKRLDSANAVVSGVISQDVLEQKTQDVIKKIAKSAKIDGFRKGKVPAHLIQSRYKDQIDKDSKQEAVQDLLQAGLKDLGIEPQAMLGNPLISKFESKDNTIDVEIKISTTPEFSLDKVEGYVPEVKLKSVSAKEIDERLAEIAKSRAPLSEVTQDRALQKDDTAVIDFEGFVDGKAFDGGKAQNFNLTIGSNQFIPGFEDALVGMKKGEKRDIEVTFPKDYQAAHLAGKPATFAITLHKIMQKDTVAIDEAFARSMLGQDATLESLKDAIKEQLEMEHKTDLYNKELKETLLQALLKEITFDLPELIVEQEMDILFRNALNTMSKEEFEALKNDEQKARQKRDSFKEDAKKSVQITFIMDALARKHNIVIQDNEALQTIYYEAMMMGQDPRAAIEYYQKNNLLPAIKMAMIEDRVLTFLLDSKLESNTDKKSTSTKEPKASKSKSSKQTPDTSA
ncbi:trigger factor [Helicobacter equorum]|uniref:Trigger factor n=1 Tax=Helicobacter equorum TaxID=361872 RepID=A0A3D8ITB8_9HELI|nr:trigger factor [Helicobacter equorum]RDU67894.1 trigger factor [Helicobacter equorum]